VDTTPAPARRSRRIAVGIAAITVGYLVASAAASTLRNPSHPAILAPAPVLWTVVAGVVGAVTFGPLGRRLHLSTAGRFWVLFGVIYALTALSNLIEAVLFVRGVTPAILLAGLLQAAGLALPAALFWPPVPPPTPDLGAEPLPEHGSTPRSGALRAAVGSRRWWSWTWRIALVSLLWVPVYFAFAAADAPFVHAYYAGSITFTIPDERLIALAEVLRGLLHATVLAGLAALLGGRRRRVWWWLAVTFAVANGWLPLLQRVDWPFFLRFANGVEITGDAVAFAGLVAWLLTRRGAASPPDPACPIIEDDARVDRRPTTSPHHA